MAIQFYEIAPQPAAATPLIWPETGISVDQEAENGEIHVKLELNLGI